MSCHMTNGLHLKNPIKCNHIGYILFKTEDCLMPPSGLKTHHDSFGCLTEANSLA